MLIQDNICPASLQWLLPLVIQVMFCRWKRCICWCDNQWSHVTLLWSIRSSPSGFIPLRLIIIRWLAATFGCSGKSLVDQLLFFLVVQSALCWHVKLISCTFITLDHTIFRNNQKFCYLMWRVTAELRTESHFLLSQWCRAGWITQFP